MRYCAGYTSKEGTPMDCHTDITATHPANQRCEPCKVEHKRRVRARIQRRYQRKRAGNEAKRRTATATAIEDQLRKEITADLARFGAQLQQIQQELDAMKNAISSLPGWLRVLVAWRTDIKPEPRQLTPGEIIPPSGRGPGAGGGAAEDQEQQ